MKKGIVIVSFGTTYPGTRHKNIERITDQVDFYMLREPQSNPQMDWNCKIEILWRPELAHIQELNAMHAYKQSPGA